MKFLIFFCSIFIFLLFIKNTSTANIKKLSSRKTLKNMNSLSKIINLKVEKYILKNGMTILLHQDNRIPQIYHQLLVKIGSKDEVTGKTGLAHLFEHMMFKGTAHYTGEEYEEKLESIGARNNAFTSRDYTAFEVLLPNNKLEMILKMEAERLNSLRLNQNNFDKEREVVKEERRQMTDNNPNEFSEPLLSLVFKTHSYGRPIIGFMKDLDKMTLQDCKDFYQSYYAPNNSILILTGNFKLEETKKWIQQYYGALKPSQIKTPPVYKEAPQIEKRFVKVERPVHAPTLAFAYQGPKEGSKEVYSLEVLNRILTSGESSRLHKLLVYKHKLALSVGGFYYGLQQSGIFIIYIKMAPQGDINKVKQIVAEELQKINSQEIPEKEILKHTRSIMFSYISAVKSLSGKADSLSSNEAYFGDYKRFSEDLDKYQQVTQQSIKKQAQLYIVPTNLSEVELTPIKK